MQELSFKTESERQVLDITEKVAQALKVKDGSAELFVTHTTCGLTTADLDPGTDQDMLEAFWKMIPAIDFRHPHNPKHAPAHLLASLIGPSLSVPVQNGWLSLGQWQRIVLVEFDGPRERKIILRENVLG